MRGQWKHTEIWKFLEKLDSQEAQDVKSFIDTPNCMYKIESVLQNGGTSPQTFTLHDADHSFRVANRMWMLISEKSKSILSEYELGLLLLSAYLHDIGMTPEYEKVNNHFIYLNTNNKKTLKPEEKTSLQRWLDDIGEQINLETDYLDNYEKSAELITFYSRHKHNDWSEDWIRKNLAYLTLERYTNWLNDLIDICKSHHYGIEELKTEKFNPFRINGKVIHKRYLAMCLRLSDVIEIDPERAPEVLLKHRNVIEGSISHWLKEKYISVDYAANTITINARPTKAFIHKAIIDTADQIQQEIILCHALKEEMPLSNITPGNDLEHEWIITSTIHRDIKEVGNYEYIDGTFKPNSKKILELLAGTELYGNPILAVRELIQNSLDAVKVQIGYKILEENIIDENEITNLRNKFSINISLTKEHNDYWITCEDNGVGMDKESILKSFLIGGASKRHELLELERKCKEKNYDLELTSQFGIGVLSYFMLADKVIIKTKKSLLANNIENNGWEFEINSLSDFGELRKTEIKTSGTKIKLKIKKELTNNIDLSANLLSLIKSILVRIPCNLNIKLFDGSNYDFKPGWCTKTEDLKDFILSEFNKKTSFELKTTDEFITEETLIRYEKSDKWKLAIESDFENSINFIEISGQLQNNIGVYRIHIPYFKNKKGYCFGYFFENNENELKIINKGHIFLPQEFPTIISWKGIKADYIRNRQRFKNYYIEIDITNNSLFEISVSRNRLKYHPEYLDNILEEIDDIVKNKLISKKKLFNNPVYGLLNKTIYPFLEIDNEKLNWVYSDIEYATYSDIMKFKEISYPLIYDISTSIINTNPQYNSKALHRIDSIRTCDDTSLSLNKINFKYDIAVFNPYYNYRISFLILDALIKKNTFSFIGNSAVFPPNWEKIICFRGYHENDIIINENSNYAKLVKKIDYEYVKSFFKLKISLNSPQGIEITKSKSKCICFILHLISINKSDYWRALVNSNPEFISRIWKKMNLTDKEAFHFFHDGISSTSMVTISINDWIAVSNLNEILDILPIPSKKMANRNK